MDDSTLDKWKRTQDNGKILYDKFPQYNLATKERNEVQRFKQFCNYFGRVLDVGSGPVIPSYLEDNRNISKAFGIDPLISNQSSKSEIILLKAIGEYLPFQNDYFDTISFATSFDHVINPKTALIETKRVLNPKGSVIFWIEKEVMRPSIIQRGINKAKRILETKIQTSQSEEFVKQKQIIDSLENIPNCADKFHLQHIRDKEFRDLANSTGFKLIDEEHLDEFSVFLKFIK